MASTNTADIANDQCDVIFGLECSITNHYSCSFCKARFHDAETVLSHIMRHTGGCQEISDTKDVSLEMKGNITVDLTDHQKYPVMSLPSDTIRPSSVMVDLPVSNKKRSVDDLLEDQEIIITDSVTSQSFVDAPKFYYNNSEVLISEETLRVLKKSQNELPEKKIKLSNGCAALINEINGGLKKKDNDANNKNDKQNIDKQLKNQDPEVESEEVFLNKEKSDLKLYQCICDLSNCHFRTNFLTNFRQHALVHHGCRVDKRIGTLFVFKSNHIEDEIIFERNPDSSVLQCVYCVANFNNQEDGLIHLDEHREDEEYFECRLHSCKYRVKKMEAIVQHISNHLSIRDYKPIPSDFKLLEEWCKNAQEFNKYQSEKSPLMTVGSKTTEEEPYQIAESSNNPVDSATVQSELDNIMQTRSKPAVLNDSNEATRSASVSRHITRCNSETQDIDADNSFHSAINQVVTRSQARLQNTRRKGSASLVNVELAEEPSNDNQFGSNNFECIDNDNKRKTERTIANPKKAKSESTDGDNLNVDEVNEQLDNGHCNTEKVKIASSNEIEHTFSSDAVLHHKVIETTDNQHVNDDTVGINTSFITAVFKDVDFTVDEDVVTSELPIIKELQACKDLKCYKCNANFSKVVDAIEHRRLHSRLSPYSCCYCNFQTAQMSLIRTHILRKHEGILRGTATADGLVYDDSTKMYACSFCSKLKVQFASLRNAEEHITIHREYQQKQLYVCHICSFKATYRKTIVNHALYSQCQQAKELSLDQKGMCHYVVKQKTKSDHCAEHTSTSYTFSRSEPEENVDDKNDNIKSLLSRSSSCSKGHQDDTAEDDKKQPLENPQCSQEDTSSGTSDVTVSQPEVTCNTTDGLKQNKMDTTSTDTMEFQCTLCEYSHSKHKNVFKHIKTSHRRSQKDCYDTYTYAIGEVEQNINLSRNVTTGMFHCPFCSDKFAKQSTSVIVHIRSVHSKEYPYKCKYCSYESAAWPDIFKHGSEWHDCEVNQMICQIKLPLNQEALESTDQSQMDSEQKDVKVMSDEEAGNRKGDEELSSWIVEEDSIEGVGVTFILRMKGAVSSKESVPVKIDDNKTVIPKPGTGDPETFLKANMNVDYIVNISDSERLALRELRSCGQYSCETCDVKIQSIGNDIVVHSGKGWNKSDPMWFCGCCNYACVYRFGLIEHLDKAHNISIVASTMKAKNTVKKSGNIVICNTAEDHVVKHMRIKHLQAYPPYVCMLCDFKCMSGQHLNFHLNLCHKRLAADLPTVPNEPRLDDKQEMEPFEFEEEVHNFGREEFLFQPGSFEKSLKKVKCPITGGYVCPFCGSTFLLWFILKSHVRIHVQEKPYICMRCHLKTRTRLQIKMHAKRCKEVLQIPQLKDHEYSHKEQMESPSVCMFSGKPVPTSTTVTTLSSAKTVPDEMPVLAPVVCTQGSPEISMPSASKAPLDLTTDCIESSVTSGDVGSVISSTKPILGSLVENTSETVDFTSKSSDAKTVVASLVCCDTQSSVTNSVVSSSASSCTSLPLSSTSASLSPTLIGTTAPCLSVAESLMSTVSLGDNSDAASSIALTLLTASSLNESPATSVAPTGASTTTIEPGVATVNDVNDHSETDDDDIIMIDDSDEEFEENLLSNLNSSEENNRLESPENRQAVRRAKRRRPHQLSPGPQLGVDYACTLPTNFADVKCFNNVCPHCGKDVSSSNNLIIHLRTHTGEKPYLCLHCGFRTGYDTSVRRHFRLNRCPRMRLRAMTNRPPTSLVEPVVADKSAEKISEGKPVESTAYEIVSEVNRKGRKQGPVDDVERLSLSNSQNDKENLTDKEKVSSDDKALEKTCHEDTPPNDTVPENSIIQLHKLSSIISQSPEYPVLNIDYTFRPSSIEQTALITLQKSPYFDCLVCKQRSKWLADAISHLRGHTGDKPYICSHCEFTAAHELAIKNHFHLKHSHLSAMTQVKRKLDVRIMRSMSTSNEVVSDGSSLEKAEVDLFQPKWPKFFAKRNGVDFKFCISDKEKQAIKDFLLTGQYKCECGALCWDRFTVTSHVRRHNLDSPYHCCHCFTKFDSAVAMATHLDLDHKLLANNLGISQANTRKTKESVVALNKDIVTIKEEIPDIANTVDAELDKCDTSDECRLEPTWPMHFAQRRNVDFTFIMSVVEKMALKLFLTTGSYLCEFCSSVCKTRIDVTAHIRRHKNDRPYNCCHCSESFDSAMPMMQHCHSHDQPPSQETSHAPTTSECGVTDSVDLNEDKKAQALSSLYGMDSIKQEVYKPHLHQFPMRGNDYTLKDNQTLDELRKSYQSFSEYFCPKCKLECASIEDALDHIVEDHAHLGYQRGFHCGLCSEKFFNEKYVRNHIVVHHTRSTTIVDKLIVSKEPMPINGGNFQCRICGAVCEGSEEIMKHNEANHAGTEKYYCTMCPFKCMNKAGTPAHASLKHTTHLPLERDPFTGNYLCAFCNKVWTHLNEEAKQHSCKVNGIGTWYVCKDCNFTSVEKSVVLLHKLFYHSNRSSEFVLPGQLVNANDCIAGDYKWESNSQTQVSHPQQRYQSANEMSLQQPSMYPTKSTSGSVKPDLPKPPKLPAKPITGYIRYSCSNYKMVKSMNPGLSVGAIGRIIGQKWNALTDKEKLPYLNAYRKDKERYDKELVEYHKSQQYQEYLTLKKLVQTEVRNQNHISTLQAMWTSKNQYLNNSPIKETLPSTTTENNKVFNNARIAHSPFGPLSYNSDQSQDVALNLSTTGNTAQSPAGLPAVSEDPERPYSHPSLPSSNTSVTTGIPGAAADYRNVPMPVPTAIFTSQYYKEQVASTDTFDENTDNNEPCENTKSVMAPSSDDSVVPLNYIVVKQDPGLCPPTLPIISSVVSLSPGFDQQKKIQVVRNPVE